MVRKIGKMWNNEAARRRWASILGRDSTIALRFYKYDVPFIGQRSNNTLVSDGGSSLCELKKVRDGRGTRSTG